MKKLDLSQAINALANVGVIAGIIFLAVELRQNTQALRAQTRDSLTEKTMTYLGWMATSPELAAIENKARSIGIGSLDPTERNQYRNFVGAQLREWENSFYQYERGLFTQADYEARRETWRNRLLEVPDSSFYRSIWEGGRTHFSPSFGEEIDGILAEGANN